MKNDAIFQVGDRVTAFGLVGTVTAIHSGVTIYPIVVEWDERIDAYYIFMLDGRLFRYHKEPSLKLVERPKKIQAAAKATDEIIKQQDEVFTKLADAERQKLIKKVSSLEETVGRILTIIEKMAHDLYSSDSEKENIAPLSKEKQEVKPAEPVVFVGEAMDSQMVDNFEAHLTSFDGVVRVTIEELSE